MFAVPRPKKGLLTQAPPSKKRKATHTVEEINFDNGARAEYLTGFRKRKLERVRKAQEVAAERARQDKISMRKQLREERQQEIEDHVKNVERILKEHRRAGLDGDGSAPSSDENEDDPDAWTGFEDIPTAADAEAAIADAQRIDHEEEYIDEDKHTTVKVEAVSIDRDGFHGPGDSEDEEEGDSKDKVNKDAADAAAQGGPGKGRTAGPPKKKKPKFRYENKADRKATDRKNRAKSSKFRRP